MTRRELAKAVLALPLLRLLPGAEPTETFWTRRIAVAPGDQVAVLRVYGFGARAMTCVYGAEGTEPTLDARLELKP